MTVSELVGKIRLRIWYKIIQKTVNTGTYPKLYKSYWHWLLNRKSTTTDNQMRYYTAIPNKGAGIGHQMANWIAGYWYARQFGLRFAHEPFSKESWETFLGFGEGEEKVETLVKNGYKKVKLPLFRESRPHEFALNKNIIDSYKGKKVVFIAEQDQFYRDQYGVVEDLRRKFFAAQERSNDQFIYSRQHLNVAIHVRRGDILPGQQNQNPNLVMRWQDNSYFEKVLTRVLAVIPTTRPVAIYLFSQGNREDFSEFEKFENIHFCLDMGPKESFLHMVFADILITSKSSFSYKPALISKGIKVCPENFWHKYPKSADYILAGDNALFNEEHLTDQLHQINE
ncbi:hypothetical protein HNQ91_000015 [Filimonas zeae]|uniref:Glycosyl transferase family 11 n=1 Tax=Filimonas zeae TaxID=1737353 RepID=A0A917ILT7_9BACT|nr:hypothetical protein [Filimonas zeae]MDR6336993.1 hypothetical protein [Filimonas zeae]GGH56494.1 hypothetical protein GCM10011379_00140 [Filimonas zeae]